MIPDATTPAERGKPSIAAGILGGMGPAATLDLMGRVLRLTPPGREQDGVRLIVDSNPTVPDRNDALLRGGPSPAPALVAMARGLQAAGADFLVMACNTAHAFQFEIERAVGVPFVSIIEEAGAEAARLAPAPGARVGLLAGEGCLEASLYQTELARRGLTPVVPEGALRAEFMELLYAIKAGDVGTESRRRMARIAAALEAEGAELLIAACTEVPLVVAPGETQAPLIDATELLARAIVDMALGRRPLPAPFAWTEVGPA